MGKSPLISVIIPTHNLENYVEAMILSLEKQTFQEFEAIIVDDGSTDMTVSKIIKLIKEDGRFKLIRKENTGISHTRLVGINNSSGKYICFLDGDDFVAKNWLEIFISDLNKTKADLISVGFSEYFEKGKKFYSQSNLFENCLLEGRNLIIEWCMDKKVKGFLWNKIFRKDILKEVYDILDCTFLEDSFVLLKYLMNIKSMYVDNEIVYFYRRRRGSLTKNKFEEKNLNIVGKFDNLFKIIYSNDSSLKNILMLRLAKIELMLLSNMSYQLIIRNSYILDNIHNSIKQNKVEKKRIFNSIDRNLIKYFSGENVKLSFFLIRLRSFMITIQKVLRLYRLKK